MIPRPSMFRWTRIHLILLIVKVYNFLFKKQSFTGKLKVIDIQEIIKVETKEGEEKLELKRGAFVQITSGKQTGLYGEIEGMDEETAR